MYLSAEFVVARSKVVNMIHRSSISAVLGRAPSLRHSVILSVFRSVVSRMKSSRWRLH